MDQDESLALASIKQTIEIAIDKVLTKYGTKTLASQKTGIEESKFSRKSNGKTGWTVDELAVLFYHAGMILIFRDHFECLSTAAVEGVNAIVTHYKGR